MNWETWGAAAGVVGVAVGIVAYPVKYVAGLGRRMTQVETDQKWLIQSVQKVETVSKKTAEEVAAVKSTAEGTDKKVDQILTHLLNNKD